MVNVIKAKHIEQLKSQAPELSSYLNQTDLVLEPTLDPPPVHLVRSIIFQQLAGAAATAIYKRFLNLINQDRSPENILTYSIEQMREVGISSNKAKYILNVAKAFSDSGELVEYRTVETLRDLSDEKIINLFSQIKGIGKWTVQMYLIFGLGRLDILAETDLGVRKGLEIIYQTPQRPTFAQAKQLAKNWHPLATIGTILCWRIQD